MFDARLLDQLLAKKARQEVWLSATNAALASGKDAVDATSIATTVLNLYDQKFDQPCVGIDLQAYVQHGMGTALENSNVQQHGIGIALQNVATQLQELARVVKIK